MFCFVFEGNFRVQAPGGAYFRRGDLTEGFCVKSLGGLYLEGLIFGILRHIGTRSLVGTPSGVSKFDFSDNFVSKNLAQIHNFTSWHGREVNLVDCSVLCVERNSERVLL